MVQERLHTAEWAAVVVSSIGTIGLGATAGADPEPSDAKPLSKTRIAVVILMFTVLVVAGISTRLRNRTKPARRATKTSAVTCGLQVSKPATKPSVLSSPPAPVALLCFGRSYVVLEVEHMRGALHCLYDLECFET